MAEETNKAETASNSDSQEEKRTTDFGKLLEGMTESIKSLADTQKATNDRLEKIEKQEDEKPPKDENKDDKDDKDEDKDKDKSVDSKLQKELDALKSEKDSLTKKLDEANKSIKTSGTTPDNPPGGNPAGNDPYQEAHEIVFEKDITPRQFFEKEAMNDYNNRVVEFADMIKRGN